MSDLHIPTPCHESWDDMTPTVNGRHCASCNHAVIDLTTMSVTAGQRVLDEVKRAATHDPLPRTCVRGHVDPSGRIVVGHRRLLTQGLAAMLACTLAGCAGDGPALQTAPEKPTTHSEAGPLPVILGTPRPPAPKPVKIDGPVVMGKMIAPTTPAPAK